MKVLYLHQYFCTPAMPGATRSYELARRLVARGHAVTMVTSDTNPSAGLCYRWRESTEAGIRVRWFGVPYSNAMGWNRRIEAFLRFSLAACRELRRHEADVIFATSTPLTIAVPAIYGSWRTGRPMVFEVRDLWPEVPIALGELDNRLLVAGARWLERLAYRRSTRIVALSPDMQNGILRRGVDPRVVSVIPNGCDDMFAAPQAEQAGRDFRARHSWLGDRPLVLYAGTLGKVNDVGYLVRVAAETLRLDANVRFLVIGSGRQEAEIRGLAAQLGVVDRNLYFLPRVLKQEMPAVLSACDISVSTVADVPALWANSANKIFDALAAGRPVAINHGGWLAEMIEAQKCGLVLPADDVAQAASSLVGLLSDRRAQRAACAAARRTARTLFDRDDHARRLEEVLHLAAFGVEAPARRRAA